MSTPVSAFQVYSKLKINLKENKTKPKRKSKKPKFTNGISVVNTKIVPEKLVKEIGSKLQKKNKTKKGAKVCVKKKSPKKSKNKKLIKTNENGFKKLSKDIIKGNNSIEDVVDNASNDTIPLLVPAPRNRDVNETFSEASIDSFDFTPVQTNSVEEGIKLLKWIIAPYVMEDFFNNVWEKKPLHIARNKPYYKEIISTPMIDDMLRNQNILFTKNIDITSYENGKRQTHNPDGRAHPHIVWDYYLNGCSIRLLNPQTFLPQLHLLNTTLQEFFHSFVGANVYLTPPASQGFAPHYDDIEAFILQIEGKKHWRVYKPLNENETLPRESSKNFLQDEIGEPIMEITLEAGHMLYFPRGYIHQAVTIDGEHSLHVTLSMYQKHSWADLFEKLIPQSLQIAISENVEFRRGLPFGIYDNFGVCNSDITNVKKTEILSTITNLFDSIKEHLAIDSAVDQMGRNYQRDALPPLLTDMEKAVTIYGDSDVMEENGIVKNRVEIELDTKVRLLRKNILRVAVEDKIKIYYHTENSLEYHGNEEQYLEIDEDLAPAIDTLIAAYPQYTSVENLNAPQDLDNLQIARDLWVKGIIMTEYPLETVFD